MLFFKFFNGKQKRWNVAEQKKHSTPVEEISVQRFIIQQDALLTNRVTRTLTAET